MANPVRVACLVALVAVAGCEARSGPSSQPTTSASIATPATHTTAQSKPPAQPKPQPKPKPTSAPKPKPAPLLFLSDQKDGDSFVASNGVEYRLGLVNTPELNEPCGHDAKTFTRNFLRNGFRVKAYSSDTYGRTVAEVLDPAGRSLNVALAASGLGNDKYLEQFRHENPGLAARLDKAFSTAPKPSCLASGNPAPAPVQLLPQTPKSGNCHPDYLTCVPIKGDGSGDGDANDLDCGDIGRRVQVGSADPYRLDADGNGVGCESY